MLRKKDKSQRIFKQTKPDIDNLVKAVLDALQDAEVLKDDSLVIGIMASKYFGAKLESKISEQGQIKIDIYALRGSEYE